MDELKDGISVETETDIAAVVKKESDEALRRFRSGDFIANLKARLDRLPVRRAFFFSLKPVWISAFSLLVLAAAALILGRGPGRGNGQIEAGFRFMTDSLGKADFFQAGGSRLASGGVDQAAGEREILSLSTALLRISAEADTGTESAATEARDAPPRPLFSPNERFKILYGDRVILKALQNMAFHKEA
jgi:hypothetical protein